MGLRYENLDDTTRRYMLEEITHDIEAGTLYMSPRLSAQGKTDWVPLLREACESGSDETLASALRGSGRLNDFETRRTRSGGTSSVRVPITAPATLAEGEFNRFYARGVCRRVLQSGQSEVQVYRAKAVMSPRPESQARIGTRVNAASLLDDLRNSPGVEPALGIPPGPNSGLTVQIPG
jgi:hypothetical protein